MPAFEIPGFSWSLPSDADLSTGNGQFRFVDINVDGEAVAATAAGRAVGVRQNKPIAGEATTIVSSGISWVEAGETVAIGEAVKAFGTTTGAGRAGDADTAADVINGVCVFGGDAGELISVLLCTPGVARVPA